MVPKCLSVPGNDADEQPLGGFPMKIDHILFPADFSDQSRALNKEVEWLAAHFNARVTLLHVFEVPTSWYGGGEYPLITSEDVVAFMDAEKKRLAQYGLNIPENRISRVTGEGSAAWHIAQIAVDRNVDLIVMGTHGYGPIRRMLLGSVAMKVLHDVNCPVWTHLADPKDSRPMKPVSNIVCALELTDEALPLLCFAKELAAEFNASVRLVHRVPESMEYKYLNPVVHDQLIAIAEEQIRTLQQKAGTAFPLSVTEKAIAEDTARIARAENADLIVIGRGKVQHAFGTLRSHAYDMIREAPCPVLSFVVGEPETHSHEKHEEAAAAWR
jgi:nucleotide-binding universal stress UspA family protein